MIYEKLEQRVNSPEFGSMGMNVAINDREEIIRAIQNGQIIEEPNGTLTYTAKPVDALADALHRTLDTKAEHEVLAALRSAYDFLERAIGAVDEEFMRQHKGIASMIGQTEDTVTAVMHDIRYDMAKKCGEI